MRPLLRCSLTLSTTRRRGNLLVSEGQVRTGPATHRTGVYDTRSPNSRSDALGQRLLWPVAFLKCAHWLGQDAEAQ